MAGEAFLESPAQDGTTKAFRLDAAGRRATEATGPTGQAATSTITRGYTDTSDNPAWATTTNAAGTATTRFATSLSGDLGLTVHTPTASGTVQPELTLADPHGDVVAVAPVPTSGPCAGISSWTDHDEYGNPLAATTPADGAGTQGLGYGWLGAKQRATTNTGLTLMGARIYNRTTGQFTSVDPIHGGNHSAYGYPVDPVNQSDLDGLHSCGWFSKVCSAVSSGASWTWRNRGTIGRYAGYTAAGICIVGTAGACTVAAGGVAAWSAASNYASYRSGQISGRRALGSTAFDVAGVFVRGVRRPYQPTRRLGGPVTRSRSLSYSIRSQPYRSAGRLAYHAASAYKSYRAW